MVRFRIEELTDPLADGKSSSWKFRGFGSIISGCRSRRGSGRLRSQICMSFNMVALWRRWLDRENCICILSGVGRRSYSYGVYHKTSTIDSMSIYGCDLNGPSSIAFLTHCLLYVTNRAIAPSKMWYESLPRDCNYSHDEKPANYL